MPDTRAHYFMRAVMLLRLAGEKQAAERLERATSDLEAEVARLESDLATCRARLDASRATVHRVKADRDEAIRHLGRVLKRLPDEDKWPGIAEARAFLADHADNERFLS